MNWLHGLVAAMGLTATNADASEPPKVAPKHKWPSTDAPDKTDPYWEANNNMNLNGTQYLKVEVAPDKWEWAVDEKAMAHLRQIEQSRRDLYWALRSRVLTVKEMAQVKQYDYHIIVEPMTPYREEDVRRQFNDALLQQANLVRSERDAKP